MANIYYQYILFNKYFHYLKYTLFIKYVFYTYYALIHTQHYLLWM